VLPQVEVNWLAIIAAAISTMVVGFIWYHPAVFGKAWQKLTGMSDDKIKNGPGVGYALTFVASLFMGYVLSHFLVYAGAVEWMDGLVTGTWIGLGFVATSFASEYIFNQKPRNLWLISAGYQVVAIAVAGAIIVAMA
jgi:hypothetical protein